MATKEEVRATNKEVVVVLVMYLLFFAWWYFTAYGFGGNPESYKYVFGFPEWFFYSCIVGYLGISVLLWIVVKFFFKDIDFEGEEKVND